MHEFYAYSAMNVKVVQIKINHCWVARRDSRIHFLTELKKPITDCTFPLSILNFGNLNTATRKVSRNVNCYGIVPEHDLWNVF